MKFAFFNTLRVSVFQCIYIIIVRYYMYVNILLKNEYLYIILICYRCAVYYDILSLAYYYLL